MEGMARLTAQRAELLPRGGVKVEERNFTAFAI